MSKTASVIILNPTLLNQKTQIIDAGSQRVYVDSEHYNRATGKLLRGGRLTAVTYNQTNVGNLPNPTVVSPIQMEIPDMIPYDIIIVDGFGLMIIAYGTMLASGTGVGFIPPLMIPFARTYTFKSK